MPDSEQPQQQPKREMTGDELRIALGFYSQLHGPILQLIDTLATYREQPSDSHQQRDIAEHAVLAMVTFLGKAGIGTGPVMDSLAALIGALHAVDHGAPHPLLKPAKKPGGRPRIPFDERVTQGALVGAMAYLRKAGLPTDSDAVRKLRGDLAAMKLRITERKLHDLLEAEQRSAKAQGFAHATAIENEVEYRRSLALLVQQLPRLLAR